MNITLNIQAGSPAELQEAITGLAGVVGGAATPKIERVTEKKQATSKTEKQPDPKTETQTKESDELTSEELNQGKPETETEEIPTVVDLRAKAQEKGKTPEGKKAIKALLDEFESKSISDVPEEKRAAFLRKLEEL